MSRKNYPWNKSKSDDGGAENEVYAGPEFFETPDRPDEPEEEIAPMEEVYAGPPMPPPMMCVYAGPEYFSGIKVTAGARAPEVIDALYCTECGTPIRKEYRFCPGCGKQLQAEEK